MINSNEIGKFLLQLYTLRKTFQMKRIVLLIILGIYTHITFHVILILYQMLLLGILYIYIYIYTISHVKTLFCNTDASFECKDE